MDSEKQKNAGHPHAGHRERVRNLFLRSGLDGFSDHNVLELLLFYAIPKSDTNVIAHNLIDRFGSLQNVLDASPAELSAVKGMGMYSATFLSILPQLARRYFAGDPHQTFSCEDHAAIQAYFCSRFIGESSECFYLMAFGSDGRRVGCTKVGIGSKTRLRIDDRSILEAAFRMNAVTVILAHNHPGGVAAPSMDDIDATKSVADTLRACGLQLADHIIIAGNECFSMAAHPQYRKIFYT